jgi:trk system potassium uptake protein TrkH
MRRSRNGINLLTPPQILVLGYLVVTIVGAILLSLPISSSDGKHQPFIDSLFVAASGISTTGLTPVDIGKYYSLFGQLVLLCIFQIGGLGYMAFAVFLAYIFRIELPFTAKIVARESLAGSNIRILERFFVVVLLFTFLFELLGAAVLSVFWAKEFPLPKVIYLGVFHSVSAFCTAGFSVFSDSVMKYRDSYTINLTIAILSIFGGIGFFVLYDCCAYLVKMFRGDRLRRMSVHSKLALLVSAIVMLCATGIVFCVEKWPQGLTWRQRLAIAGFQAISASTTDGFNTIDIGAMSMTGLSVLMVLMFIGASPGSTGGGIKTTTAGLCLAFLFKQLKARELRISLFKRQIPSATVFRAFCIVGWFLIILAIDAVIMTATEYASFQPILFEAVSALGNTGLSMGITSQLTFTGKLMLIITMFIGRVGLLTAGLFLIGRQKPAIYEYATEDIYVG